MALALEAQQRSNEGATRKEVMIRESSQRFKLSAGIAGRSGCWKQRPWVLDKGELAHDRRNAIGDHSGHA